MNITFLVIILSITVIVYLIQNLFKVRLRANRRYFWYLQVSVILILFEAILVTSGTVEYFPHILFISWPLKCLLIPLLVLITLKIANYRSIPTLLKNGYFIPAILVFIPLISVYSLDAEKKLSFFQESPNLLLYVVWGLIISNIFFIIRFYRGFQIVRRQHEKHSWYFVFGILSVFILQFVGIFNWNLIPVLDIASSTSVILLLFMYWYSQNTSSPTSENERVLKIITESMDGQKLYLQPNLTLKTLSDHLGLTPNEISKAINSGLSMSFNDYINNHRVNEFIRLIRDDNNSNYTLEGISKMAGFNSTTTFNKAFKKSTGKTPKEYKTMTES